MKQLITAALIGFALIQPVLADHGSRRLERLAQELQLTEEQQQAVHRIMDAQKERFRTLHDSGADREQMHQQMQSMHEELREQLRTVLNDDQMQRMEELHRKHRKGFRGEEHHAERFERFSRELGLSEEQKAKAAEIMKQQHALKKEMFDSGAGREQMHERMQSLHRETMEKLGTVLDAEQLSRLEQMHEERHRRFEKHHRHDSAKESEEQ